LVQADRIPGYDESDGNWTGGRRYYIEADDSNEVSSTVLEELGEVDMGAPETLSDFLLWAHENYPAERMALVMWNHGDGWSVAPSTDGSVPPPYISWDMTEGTWMSIAAGDLTAGLDAIVEERGPLDLVAFDACNMGSWEVGHSLREHVRYMAGSETVVGMSGYQYDLVLEGLREEDWTGAELADQMAWSSADFNGEWTHVALDLAGMDGLAVAVDELAAAVLADESRQDLFLDARNTAGAADLSDAWHDYMVDLHDLGEVLAGLDEATLVERGAAIDQAMEDSVVSFYSSSPFEWAGGLSIFAETDWDYLEEYAEGEGATWSQQTQWDDLLVELAGEPSL
ncbi:MAG: clostripain-related cysteine peptidase, partial [Myxococcota bacterium]|nr:clostripain-related cysteine peptidase [Myxococcota bacterium]